MSSKCQENYECHTSVSSLILAEKCQLRWHLRKVSKLIAPEPPSYAMTLGSACHSQVEACMDTGQEPDLALAKVARDLLPSAAAPVSELELDHIDLGLAWPLYGFVDWYDPATGTALDLKFSGAPERYLPQTKEDMAADLQLCMYTAALWKWGLLCRRVGQIQVNTNNATGRLLTAEVSVPLVHAALERARKVSWRMRAAADTAPREELANGPAGIGPYCRDYNRPCEALELCRGLRTASVPMSRGAFWR